MPAYMENEMNNSPSTAVGGLSSYAIPDDMLYDPNAFSDGYSIPQDMQYTPVPYKVPNARSFSGVRTGELKEPSMYGHLMNAHAGMYNTEGQHADWWERHYSSQARDNERMANMLLEQGRGEEAKEYIRRMAELDKQAVKERQTMWEKFDAADSKYYGDMKPREGEYSGLMTTLDEIAANVPFSVENELLGKITGAIGYGLGIPFGAPDLGMKIGSTIGGAYGGYKEGMVHEGTDVYNNLRQKGYTHEEADAIATKHGLQEWAGLALSNTLQGILFDKMLFGDGAFGNSMVGKISSLGADALWQSLEEIGQNAHKSYSTGDPFDLDEALHEGKIAGLSSLLTGGLMMGTKAAVDSAPVQKALNSAPVQNAVNSVQTAAVNAVRPYAERFVRQSVPTNNGLDMIMNAQGTQDIINGAHAEANAMNSAVNEFGSILGDYSATPQSAPTLPAQDAQRSIEAEMGTFGRGFEPADKYSEWGEKDDVMRQFNEDIDDLDEAGYKVPYDLLKQRNNRLKELENGTAQPQKRAAKTTQQTAQGQPTSQETPNTGVSGALEQIGQPAETAQTAETTQTAQPKDDIRKRNEAQYAEWGEKDAVIRELNDKIAELEAAGQKVPYELTRQRSNRLRELKQGIAHPQQTTAETAQQTAQAQQTEAVQPTAQETMQEAAPAPEPQSRRDAERDAERGEQDLDLRIETAESGREVSEKLVKMDGLNIASLDEYLNGTKDGAKQSGRKYSREQSEGIRKKWKQILRGGNGGLPLDVFADTLYREGLIPDNYPQTAIDFLENGHFVTKKELNELYKERKALDAARTERNAQKKERLDRKRGQMSESLKDNYRHEPKRGMPDDLTANRNATDAEAEANFDDAMNFFSDMAKQDKQTEEATPTQQEATPTQQEAKPTEQGENKAKSGYERVRDKIRSAIESVKQRIYKKDDISAVAELYTSMMEAEARETGTSIEDVAARWNINFADEDAKIPAGSNDKVYHQFIGKKGAKALLTRMQSLTSAKKMEADGRSSDSIFWATGWYKNGSGKWAYDIDNSAFNFKRGIKDISLDVPYKLGDIFDAPELYKAYPELADVSVVFSNKDSSNKYEDKRGKYKRNENTISMTVRTPQDKRITGREIAKHLLSSEFRDEYKHTLLHEIQHVIQSIEGVDFQDEANQYLYQDRPNEVEARRAAARSDLTETQRKILTPDIEGEHYSHLDTSDDMFRRWEELKKKIQDGTLDDVTPEELGKLRSMLEKAETEERGGNVIFKNDELNGAVTTFIQTLKNGDKSTLLHEAAHVWFEMRGRLMNDANANISEQAKADWETLNEWLNLDHNDNQSAQEKFAAGFEQYLAEGKAPSSRLERIFKTFKEWLTSIYGHIKNIKYRDSDGQLQEFTLSDEIRDVMDRIVGGSNGTETKAKTATAIKTVNNTVNENPNYAKWDFAYEDATQRKVGEIKVDSVSGRGINTIDIYAPNGKDDYSSLRLVSGDNSIAKYDSDTNTLTFREGVIISSKERNDIRHALSKSMGRLTNSKYNTAFDADTTARNADTDTRLNKKRKGYMSLGGEKLAADDWSGRDDGTPDSNRSYRFTREPNAVMSDYGHAMFADDVDANSAGYGDYAWSVSNEDLTSWEDTKNMIVSAIEGEINENGELDGEMKRVFDQITDDYEYRYEEKPSTREVAEAIAEEFNPQDIVESAGAWDNGDMMEWFYNNVAKPNKIKGVKTQDGAISFEESIISPARGMTEFYHGADVEDVQTYGRSKRRKGGLSLDAFRRSAEKAEEDGTVKSVAARQESARAQAADDADTEARMQEAFKGVKDEAGWKKTWEGIKKAIGNFHSEFPELSRDKTLYRAMESLRRRNSQSNSAIAFAVDSLKKSLGMLKTPEQYQLFTRKRVFDDLAEQLKTNPDALLPFGLTPETLASEREKITKLTESDKTVGKAIETEEAEIKRINDEMIDLAEKAGLKGMEKILSREHYFHHEVIAYAQAAMLGETRQDGGKGMSMPTNRGYQKKRHGSAMDINLNYAQAMGTVRALMLRDIETLRALAEIKADYDRSAEFADGKKAIPDGYTEYNPYSGNLIFSLGTVADHISEATAEEMAKQYGTSAEDIQRVVSGRQETWIIPQGIADALNRIGKANTPKELKRVAKMITNQWKNWTLNNPIRALAYNLRNVTGDSAAAFAGNVRTFLYAPRAIGELRDVYFGGKKASGELAEFQKRGGAALGNNASLLYDPAGSKAFKNLDARTKGERAMEIAKHPLRSFMDGARFISDFREQILRYATYLSYLDQMKKSEDGKTPDNWGASKREEVLAVDDARDRAFKMSNELIGAYDQVSVSGQEIRDSCVPFYAWLEVNSKRFGRLLANNPANVAGKFGAAYAMMYLFNNFFHKDEEDELPEDVRWRPHINLGKWGGKVRYFDRIGMMTDLFEWVGLDDITSVKQVWNGQLSVEDFLKDMALAVPKKMVDAMGPGLKTAVELRTNTDTYTGGRINQIDDHVMNTLGLRKIYRALMGKRGEDITLTDSFFNMFSSSAEGNRVAYSHIKQKVREYQERVLKRGSGGFSGEGSPKSEAWRDMISAAEYGQKKKYNEARKRYIRAGGDLKSIKEAKKRLDPLSGLSKEDRVKFLRWLTPEERKLVTGSGRAMKHYYKVTARIN